MGSRVSARHVMAFQSSLLTLLKSDASLHFPSPAYGEARDGDLATAPRGGNGGGAFSQFSVVVAVGPSRGGRSGGHKRQLGWDASQDSRRMLLAESVTDEAASNMARAGRGGARHEFKLVSARLEAISEPTQRERDELRPGQGGQVGPE